jgi:hypothetical protein
MLAYEWPYLPLARSRLTWHGGCCRAGGGAVRHRSGAGHTGPQPRRQVTRLPGGPLADADARRVLACAAGPVLPVPGLAARRRPAR